MTQVSSISLVGAPETEPHHGQQPPAGQVMLPREDVTASLQKEIPQEAFDRAEEKISEADAMDDEVQLVLSVPRRRKKKRKRFAFSHSLLGLYQETRPLPGEISRDDTRIAECSSRRKSTSVVQRLEFCHTGDKDAGLRRGSLPTVSISMNTPAQQVSWSPEPDSRFSHQSPQFPSFAVPVPWWEEPTTAMPHNPLSASNWWQLEDIRSKKRKCEQGWQDGGASRKQHRSSAQISPRTNPISMNMPTRFMTQQTSATPSNTYERLMPDHSKNMTWPSFDWEPYRVSNPQYVSPYSQPTLPMDITDSNPCTASHQMSSFQDWPQHTGLFQQDFDCIQANCSTFSPSQSPLQRPVAPATGYPTQSQVSEASPPQQTLLRSQSQRPSTTLANYSTAVPASRGSARQEATYSSIRPALSTSMSPQPNVRGSESSDVLRKPSLYTIPAWPAAPSSPVSSSTKLGRPAAPVNSTAQNPRRTSLQNVSAPKMTPQPPSVVQKRRPTSNPNTPARVNQSISPSARTPTSFGPSPTTHIEEFQIPRARAGRKHSPNIIVDIAETCQEVFPFAAVAERHNIPIQKVFDTFSAIIQLPLLRNADDRRRHGSLGKRRIKEYRDAKKAMEKAQEAERKAEMRAMRARIEEAGKKSQGQANGNLNGSGKALLKTAILNNAGKSQGVRTA